MHTKKEYDLIFSIGEACSCTQVLRDFNLQFCSYPFDWLFGSNLVDRVKILTSNFEKFIEKDNLEYCFEAKSIKCKAYYNRHNDITFNHDFPNELSFDEGYELVREKYKRRTARLIDNIENAKSILIVSIETPAEGRDVYKDEDIINAYNIFNERFPNKNIDLFYLSHKPNARFSKEEIAKGVYKIIGDYKLEKNNSVGYLVDSKKLKNIFKTVRLKGSTKIVLKKKFDKFWINFVPVKSLRKKLRKKFHV